MTGRPGPLAAGAASDGVRQRSRSAIRPAIEAGSLTFQPTELRRGANSAAGRRMPGFGIDVEGLDRGDRVGGDRLGRQVLVDDLVDEGRVGAVLEQPAHQVGEQVAVRADRRVDAAARALALADDLVQRLAHAVQPLELEAARVAGHRQHRGDGVGVVGGELRVDAVARVEQLAGVGEVADVGRGLAGEDREVGQAALLRPLDLAVPVGALDQPHHDPAAVAAGEGVEPVDHRAGAAAVGLDDDAEAVPAGELRGRRAAPRSRRATGRAGRPPRRRC